MLLRWAWRRQDASIRRRIPFNDPMPQQAAVDVVRGGIFSPILDVRRVPTSTGIKCGYQRRQAGGVSLETGQCYVRAGPAAYNYYFLILHMNPGF